MQIDADKVMDLRTIATLVVLLFNIALLALGKSDALTSMIAFYDRILVYY